MVPENTRSGTEGVVGNGVSSYLYHNTAKISYGLKFSYLQISSMIINKICLPTDASDIDKEGTNFSTVSAAQEILP